MGLAVDKGARHCFRSPLRPTPHPRRGEARSLGSNQAWDKEEAELRMWPWGLSGVLGVKVTLL